MKKLAIVALALVIAMSFVGCGLASQLIGTWEYSWGGNQKDQYEFKAGNEFVYTYYINGDVSASYTGEWDVDGEELILSRNGSEARIKVEIDGDTLKMFYGDSESAYLPYTRVK